MNNNCQMGCRVSNLRLSFKHIKIQFNSNSIQFDFSENDFLFLGYHSDFKNVVFEKIHKAIFEDTFEVVEVKISI